jgi:hypothetical protein
MKGLCAPKSRQLRRLDSKAEVRVLTWGLLLVGGSHRLILRIQRRKCCVQDLRGRWPGRQTGAVRIVVCMIPKLRGKLKPGVIALRHCGSRLGWQSPRTAALAGCPGRRMARRWSHHGASKTDLDRPSRRRVIRHCSCPTLPSWLRGVTWPAQVRDPRRRRAAMGDAYGRSRSRDAMPALLSSSGGDRWIVSGSSRREGLL